MHTKAYVTIRASHACAGRRGPSATQIQMAKQASSEVCAPGVPVCQARVIQGFDGEEASICHLLSYLPTLRVPADPAMSTISWSYVMVMICSSWHVGCLQEALSLRKIFRPLVRRGEMNGYPVLLLGSLRSGPKALWDYATGSR